MGAFQELMQSDKAAGAMPQDGVRLETLLILVQG
jgi:hypothetical protein